MGSRACWVAFLLLVWLFPRAEASDLSTAAAHGWFREARFGIFVHYLGGGADWNQKVDSFDVQRFAEQVDRMGAGYLILTLGQNSGYYCSPNATYEKYAGYQPGERCSKRDLPMEVAVALASKGIRLMLYLPSRAPQNDPKAMKGLGDVHERQPAPQYFTRRWSEVIREWSLRYGDKVAGWWFDGAYNTSGWDDLSKPFNWVSWAASCRAGNQESILAFNRGAEINHAFIKQTGEQDYTAGEQNDFVATPASNPAPQPLQWHLLAHLGSRWAEPDGPQRPDAYMIDYMRRVNDAGGVVTLEVNCSYDGKIYGPHRQQVERIAEALKGKEKE